MCLYLGESKFILVYTDKIAVVLTGILKQVYNCVCVQMELQTIIINIMIYGSFRNIQGTACWI